MGKSTISMAIFNSYVKLPEGRRLLRHPRREMRSTGLRVGLLGWAQLLTAAGRNSPWRAALSMLRRREAEGMRLDDVALRKMWLGEAWEIPLFYCSIAKVLIGTSWNYCEAKSWWMVDG